MRHHAGLSNGFWIYAVKAKLHTYNVTPIKRADYKTPTELWSGIKPNISHLRVFGCQAWVHILKKRRSKLEPKSREMIFVGYELGSKGYQFWDAAHHHIEISRDVKFNETRFPAKEVTKSQASVNDLPISESDNDSDQLGLELVIPAQSPPRPPSPGQSTRKPTRTHPLPHPRFHSVRYLPDQDNHLQSLNLPYLNIPFAKPKSDWHAKINLPLKMLTPF